MTRQEIAINIGKNIEKERFELGYSQSQMAALLDMSLSAYKRILNGETTNISYYTVFRMYEITHKLGIEICGEMSPEIKIYNKLCKLTKTQLRLLDAVIDFEAAFSEELVSSDNADDYLTVFVPTGSMTDGMIYDSFNIEKVNIAPYRKRYGNLISCGIRVTSNHLHPIYHLNDILLVSRQPIRDGDTGIFLNKESGLAYIRKFHQTDPCALEPLNNYGETFYVDSRNEREMNKWLKFGYVITRMRT